MFQPQIISALTSGISRSQGPGVQSRHLQVAESQGFWQNLTRSKHPNRQDAISSADGILPIWVSGLAVCAIPATAIDLLPSVIVSRKPQAPSLPISVAIWMVAAQRPCCCHESLYFLFRDNKILVNPATRSV